MLNQKETKRLVLLLKKIDKPHEGLPQLVFDALTKIVPFVACELVIAEKEGVLLTWREDKWWKGWHFPGGLLRFQESFKERIEQVAWKEFGVNVSSFKFLFAKDCSHSKRGCGVSLVFLCKTAMAPNRGKFFKKMPKNIIGDHRELWMMVKKII